MLAEGIRSPTDRRSSDTKPQELTTTNPHWTPSELGGGPPSELRHVDLKVGSTSRFHYHLLTSSDPIVP